MYENDEFGEDFGAPALDDEQLAQLLATARATGNRDLRQLIGQHRALRHVTTLLLSRLEENEPAQRLANDQLIKLARFIVRGEGGIGSSP
jgi:hypothetical protein